MAAPAGSSDAGPLGPKRAALVPEQHLLPLVAFSLQLPTIGTFSNSVPLPGKRVAIVGAAENFQQRVGKLHNLPDDHGVRFSYSEDTDTEPVEVHLHYIHSPLGQTDVKGFSRIYFTVIREKDSQSDCAVPANFHTRPLAKFHKKCQRGTETSATRRRPAFPTGQLQTPSPSQRWMSSAMIWPQAQSLASFTGSL